MSVHELDTYKSATREMQKTLREFEIDNVRQRDRVRALEARVRELDGTATPLSSSREAAFLYQLQHLRSATGHTAVSEAAHDLLRLLRTTINPKRRWRAALMRLAGVDRPTLSAKAAALADALAPMDGGPKPKK